MKSRITIISICLFLFCQHLQAQSWQPVGPIAFPTNRSGQIHGIGRVCQIKFHPNNPNRMYAVSASGGLWISNDAGAHWQKTGTDELPQTSCSAVCIDFTNDNIIYLSTGDANYYGNSYGIYKSTDGGATWSPSNNNIANRMAVEILMSPTDRNTLIAATKDGIWKTTNGGVNWTPSLIGTQFTDMAYQPGSSTVLYAASFSACYRSSDNGNSWTRITSINPPAGNGGRIAVSAANPNIVYAGFIGSNSGSNGGIIYRSTDGGLTFTMRKGDSSPNIVGYDANSNGQGNYNFTLFADRNNADILYVGAHCNWKSTDGGANWTMLTRWWEKCHTDMHHIATSPYNNNRLFNANDGGIFVSTDGGSNWTPSADGLSATEIYNFGNSKLADNIIGIGTQDNGELYYDGNTWYTIRGGDWGPQYAFDYANTNVAYYISDAKRRDIVLQNGDQSIGLSNSKSQDIYAFTPLNTNLAFVGQANALRRSTNILNSSPSWTTPTTFNGTIMAIAIPPDNMAEAYVLTNDARVYYSSNSQAVNPGFPNISTLPGSANVKGNLVVIKSNTNVLYASANSKVYRSDNKGGRWTDVSGDLPNVNIIDLQHDQFSNNESVYIATAVGVYYKNNTMSKWNNISAGLPTVASITNLRLFNQSQANSTLRVSFYGRGEWQYRLNGNAPCDAPIPRTQYSIYQFDSQEMDGEKAPATNAIDGDNSTYWHTQWYWASPPPPHYIVVNLGGTYNVTKLGYLPRQNSTNGRINAYQVQVSADGVNWITAATGNFTNETNQQFATFSNPVRGRYVKLIGNSEVNGNPWSSAAELAIYGCAAGN